VASLNEKYGLKTKSRKLIIFRALTILVAVSVVAIGYEIHRRSAIAHRWTADRTLIHAGMVRTYWEHVPVGYDGSHPIPLVLMLHGAGGDGVAAERISAWSALAESHGFIAVFPNGDTWWNAYDWANSPDNVGS